MGKAFKTKAAIRQPSEAELANIAVATKAEEIGIPAAQLARGGFQIVDVKLERGEKVQTNRTLINRGGSAIERWLAETPSKLFGEQERSAIRYCQALWARIDRKGPPDLSGVRASLWMGQSEHEALSALSSLKKRFPVRQWSCFENICRFELDAASSGMVMAGNARSASDASKTCVAFVAAMIAQWEGF